MFWRKNKEPIIYPPKEKTYTLIIFWIATWWFNWWIHYFEYTINEVKEAIKQIKSKKERVTIWLYTYKRKEITAYKLKVYEPKDR